MFYKQFTNNLQIHFQFTQYVNVHLVCKLILQSISRQDTYYLHSMEERRLFQRARARPASPWAQRRDHTEV